MLRSDVRFSSANLFSLLMRVMSLPWEHASMDSPDLFLLVTMVPFSSTAMNPRLFLVLHFPLRPWTLGYSSCSIFLYSHEPSVIPRVSTASFQTGFERLSETWKEYCRDFFSLSLHLQFTLKLNMEKNLEKKSWWYLSCFVPFRVIRLFI